MKKILSILLALSMLISAFCIPVSAESEELTLTVANDLHYSLVHVSADEVVKLNSVSEDYKHISAGGQLNYESLAIITAFFEKAGTDESDVVLLPGDLVNVGTKEEHNEFASILEDFEKNYGKQVYVVPGNHDLFNTSAAEFETIYAQFGYADALANDSLSASYTVDLNDEYRLIAIDSCAPGLSPNGMTADRVNWIKEQAAKAKEDGKKIIAMMHHNLVEHFILGSTIHPGAVVNDKELNLPEVFAQCGIKYTFTGHTHDHDIMSYTAEDGTVIYDAVTSSINSYPCPYRVVKFGNEVKFETRFIDSVDSSLIPDGISDEALNLLESDFTAYSKESVWVGFEAIITNYVSGTGLKNLIKSDDEAFNEIIVKVGDKLNEGIKMPFNKADETEEGKSIESLVEKYDVDIPDTDYKNMIDLVTTLYQAHVLGDEYYPGYSDEIVLTSRGLAGVLNYALSDVTGEEYAKVMSFLCGLLNVNVPVDFFKYAGDGVKRFEGVEIFITTAIVPLLVEFTTDDAPADNNVTLPGYNTTGGEELNFFEKIAKFFTDILDFIKTLFTFLPFGPFKNL